MCIHTNKEKIKNIPIAFGNANQNKNQIINKTKAFLNAFIHKAKYKLNQPKTNKAFLNAPNNQKLKQQKHTTNTKTISHPKIKPMIDTKNHNKTTNKHQNTLQKQQGKDPQKTTKWARPTGLAQRQTKTTITNIKPKKKNTQTN